ncbi:FecR domain-containing protein [Maridesulfovibrio sp.]|uniref:FecR domain-containing protein n=1 Tax=Maridesulfovibrio sp. TaxID=2795000 RepID=UPI003BA91312
MPPEANQDSIGVVLAANGEVFLRSESGIRQVEAGAEVFRGEELVTGAGSTAEIRFVDDTLLSQGADSAISLDDYVFDDSASEAELLFKMSQGTFRLVTGKIAEQNPDRFQVGTPLATIGIRGTTIVSEITPGGGQKIGVEEIHAGKALLVQSITGEIRMISNARELVDIAMSGQLGTVRAMTTREFDSFREIAPSAIRQEQEIQQQRQEEEQQDQQGDPQDQGQDEQGQDAQGEGDQQGDVEGGETGGPAIPGQGVLDPGLGVMDPGAALAAGGLAGALGSDVPAGALAELEALAEDVISAVSVGDIEAAQNLLSNLQTVTDDIIDELVGNGDIPEEAQGKTVSDGDGNNWILGTTGDDSLKGGDGADSINGLAGNDTIWGQKGNDLIYGEAGNDTIYGECDNDTIAGGDGDDTIAGGYGENLIDGGAGTDLLSLADVSASSGPYVNMDYSGCGCPSGYTGIVSLYIDDVTYETFFVNIEGVIGSGSNDYIEGNSGNNYLAGESGNDTLIGEMGNDTLYGGYGKDTLTGGSGADKYLYKSTSECPATATNADYVTDFVSGTDKFVFSTSGGFAVGGTPFATSSDYNGSTGTGLSANAQFVYDSTNDQLWYDADGSGSGAGVAVANLVGSSHDVTSGDIEFVA